METMHEKLKTVSFHKQNREKMLSSQSTSRVCLVPSSSAVFSRPSVHGPSRLTCDQVFKYREGGYDRRLGPCQWIVFAVYVSCPALNFFLGNFLRPINFEVWIFLRRLLTKPCILSNLCSLDVSV